MINGRQIEEARLDKRAALPLLIQDPVRARQQEAHDDAHGQLETTARLDRIGLTPLRARNRLRTLRRLERFLNRTEHIHVDAVPCRAERERLIGPVIAALETLARRRRRERETPRSTSTRETRPMRNNTIGRIFEEDPVETARRLAAEEAARRSNGLRLKLETLLFVDKLEGLYSYASHQPPLVLTEAFAQLARHLATFDAGYQLDAWRSLYRRALERRS